MKLDHVVDIRVANNKAKAKIHIMGLDGQRTLCRRISRFIDIEGTKIDILATVTKSVDCLDCSKALEMALRDSITKLPAERLEALFMLIHGKG